ncbi:MAG: thiamine phosphate synthase [Thaumarchaeota archaeon]|nr:thiamine phosphate synthase [Nitrososphaerota archaeon]
MMKRRLSGLYFVVDPTDASEKLFTVLEAALRGGVDIVQVWSAWQQREPLIDRLTDIHNLTRRYGVSLIINNDVDMAETIGAEGMHMDGYDLTPREIRTRLGESRIVGYTTGNDLQRVKWAEKAGADYISFCSIYPSPSVANCDIVPLETVRKARKMVQISIFASGGINLGNAKEVLEAGADGIAVISAIQRAGSPEEVAREFKKIVDSALAIRALSAKIS